MDEIAAFAEAFEQIAGTFEIADHRLAAVKARRLVAHERAHDEARREQLAQDVASDESGCAC